MPVQAHVSSDGLQFCSVLVLNLSRPCSQLPQAPALLAPLTMVRKFVWTGSVIFVG